jgi:invasion protein IalB
MGKTSDLISELGLRVAVVLAVLTCAAAVRAQEPKKKAPAAAPAQQAAPQNSAQAAPGWAVRCNNAGQGLVCKAVQTIVLAKTRQLLLSIAVNRPAEGKNGTMLLQLPHGLYNPAGVKLSVDDGAAEALEIQTCDAKGCYAGAPVTPEKQVAMIKGTKLNVVFQDLKKQNITVPVPLKGFEEAFNKL